MIQIVYLSFATLELKAHPESHINSILREANEHNSANDITGQLIYRNGIFVQLLEGRKEDVELILGRILLDHKRHENLKVLLKQPMKLRSFPEWSMAFVKLENAALDMVNSILPWQELIDNSTSGQVDPNKILEIFENLQS